MVCKFVLFINIADLLCSRDVKQSINQSINHMTHVNHKN